jgi:hypothetical protein
MEFPLLNYKRIIKNYAKFIIKNINLNSSYVVP